MQLHKQGFVRGIIIFSLAVLFAGFGAVSAPAVRAAESIDDLRSLLSELEAQEEKNSAELEALRNGLGVTARPELVGWQVGRLLSESERISLEKAELDARIDRVYHEALAAASGNAGGAEPEENGFTWPIPGYTEISCSYGGGHRGVDVTGSDIYGQPIAAAEDGTVLYSGWEDSYGYCVFIEHEDGFITGYAHASELACSSGDTVKRGDTIAYVGSTGYSTGPHLHFEVLENEENTDPLDYFPISKASD